MENWEMRLNQMYTIREGKEKENGSGRSGDRVDLTLSFAFAPSARGPRVLPASSPPPAPSSAD